MSTRYDANLSRAVNATAKIVNALNAEKAASAVKDATIADLQAQLVTAQAAAISPEEDQAVKDCIDSVSVTLEGATAPPAPDAPPAA